MSAEYSVGEVRAEADFLSTYSRKTSQMLAAYAERIAADESAVPIGTVQESGYGGHIARVPITVPVGAKVFTRPPAQAAQVDAVDWQSLSERNRTMHGEFCSLLSDLQREWMKEGAEDGSDAIDAAYEALHQFVSRIATHPHSPDAADSGRVASEVVAKWFGQIEHELTAKTLSERNGDQSWKFELRAFVRECQAALAAQGLGEVTEKARDLVAIVNRQCCGFTSGPGWTAFQASLALNAALKAANAPPASPAGVPDQVRFSIERCLRSQEKVAEQIEKSNPGDPYAALMIREDIEVVRQYIAAPSAPEE